MFNIQYRSLIIIFLFPDIDCIKSINKGENYKGTVNTTALGNHCTVWKNNDVHYQFDHNYCRNPDRSDRPWCYVDITGHPRQDCNITYCGKILSYKSKIIE